MPAHPHLTDLEQLLLLSVLRQEDDAYAATLQADIEDSAERRVSLGSIHVTLARLEERALVRSQKTAPQPVRGGKARRRYAVTEEGRGALEWNRAVLEKMWGGVPAEDRSP